MYDTPAEIEEYFTEFQEEATPCRSHTVTESVVHVLGDDVAAHSGLYEFTTNAGVVNARFTFAYRTTTTKNRHHDEQLPLFIAGRRLFEMSRPVSR